MSNNSVALNCFLCGENASDIKKLKCHLLLKHSKSNICLFCIEKKGWSSEFPRNAFNTLYIHQTSLIATPKFQLINLNLIEVKV